jgi:hypothetical protein
MQTFTAAPFASCPRIAVRRTVSLRWLMSRASTSKVEREKDVDGRDKPGHDGIMGHIERCAQRGKDVEFSTTQSRKILGLNASPCPGRSGGMMMLFTLRAKIPHGIDLLVTAQAYPTITEIMPYRVLVVTFNDGVR